MDGERSSACIAHRLLFHAFADREHCDCPVLRRWRPQPVRRVEVGHQLRWTESGPTGIDLEPRERPSSGGGGGSLSEGGVDVAGAGIDPLAGVCVGYLVCVSSVRGADHQSGDGTEQGPHRDAVKRDGSEDAERTLPSVSDDEPLAQRREQEGTYPGATHGDTGGEAAPLVEVKPNDHDRRQVYHSEANSCEKQRLRLISLSAHVAS